MGAFKEPHGGELKNLYLADDEAAAEKKAARDFPSWDLTERQLCDIEPPNSSLTSSVIGIGQSTPDVSRMPSTTAS